MVGPNKMELDVRIQELVIVTQVRLGPKQFKRLE